MSIVVVGSSNTDMIIKVPHLPGPGETVLGGKFTRAAGGKGANQAVAAARAGGEVTFVAKVGDDMFGESAINGFIQDEIRVDFVSKDPSAPSGVAQIFVSDSGENCIAVASGANANLSVDDIRAVGEVIKTTDMLLVQLETPLDSVAEAVHIAYVNSIPVILNPAPAQSLSDSLLEEITVLTPNETEAEMLTGIEVKDQKSASKASQVLRAKGVKSVIITMGGSGAFVDHEGHQYQVPGFKVEPVDTTAAGDTFNGALAVALSENIVFKDAVRFANAAAALSVTQMGAQPSIPYVKDIEKLLK